ncbi:hypothetical protein LWI28_007291 [Acer negundo]|uniref:Protein SIEVE ELEMENT OCCLUSION B-like n=1 Tax=Acer negundo TaxID=4023 RepID=A0AAD5IPE8_ACENE|nr:hypothetical protein LWI28_007291 [Acer negundo]KAK4843555.1 hypothetical protein QYF36_009748 [Acer negundo]
MQQLNRSDRMMFSASDDSAMMKQIQATHTPDGREVDVNPVLHIIEDILQRATPSNIDGVLNGTSGHVDALEENTNLQASFDGMLEALSYIIHKISCELSCKCSGGGDAHATTMLLFNSTLTNYSWDAKMVLTLAAFAVNYGEFWLVAQLCTTNSLSKSVALLKQLPDILEHYNSLKPQFDAVNKLIKAMLDLTKCIIEFKELPNQYISTDLPAMSTAMAHIPAAAYWTIRSIVACSSQIASLVGLRAEYIASTTEAWELSSLAHKVSSILDHLKKQITLCHQHIDEKRQIEAYHNLVRLLETIHMDNMKVLRALIYAKDDRQPLVEGSNNTTVHIDVLRKKHVLLLISDLDISHEEIAILDHMYRESKAGSEHYYEILWLPVVDRSIAWHEGLQQKFEQLQTMMPWYSVHHPSLIEPAVIKYIKEVLHFSKKPILVPLDPQGRVLNQNAFNMLWIWRNLAFPFTSEREEALWNAESWGLELLVDRIDVNVLNWIAEGKYICVYGGEDIEWIRKFTSAAKAVANAAQIALEMVYVGKSNARERLRKNVTTIMEENLSYSLTDPTSIYFFWARLESMLYSKSQHGKSVENDHIMQEVMTLLGFDGSDQGWAIFCKGTFKDVARAKGDRALTSMLEFGNWSGEANQIGFVQGLNIYLQQLHTPHHCNRLILPGTDGGLPGKVICAECGRIMERFFMYRCCVD